MINESLILVRFTFATNSHFIDTIADKFVSRYQRRGLKYIVTEVVVGLLQNQQVYVHQTYFDNIEAGLMGPGLPLLLTAVETISFMRAYISTFYRIFIVRIVLRGFSGGCFELPFWMTHPFEHPSQKCLIFKMIFGLIWNIHHFMHY